MGDGRAPESLRPAPKRGPAARGSRAGGPSRDEPTPTPLGDGERGWLALHPGLTALRIRGLSAESFEPWEVRTVPLPELLARSLTRFLWNIRMTSFPPEELDYIKYVCMVDGTRAREVLGFEPKKSLRESIEAVRH